MDMITDYSGAASGYCGDLVSELQGYGTFENVSRSSLNILTNHSVITEAFRNKRYNKLTLFNLGDNIGLLHFLLSGTVREATYDTDGKVCVRYIASDQGWIGLPDALNDNFGRKHKSYAEVMSSSKFLSVPIENFKRVESRLDFNRHINQELLQRNYFLVDLRTLQSFSADDKITYLLCAITKRYGNYDEKNEFYQLDDWFQTDIANLIGISRENVNRVFKELKSKHFVSNNGHQIIVNDLEGLLVCVGEKHSNDEFQFFTLD